MAETPHTQNRNGSKISRKAVADQGFDLRGAWTLSTGGGGECRKSLKVLKAEVKVILSVFLARFL